jgi:cystathionine beta-lyase
VSGISGGSQYNFDTVIDRKGTDSLKWDFAAERGKMVTDILPMWVADMDFACPPEVSADLRECVTRGVYGYTEAKPDYYEALTAWFSRRYGYSFDQSDVVKTPGVIFAMALAIQICTEPEEAVLVQPPVYHPFFDIARNNRRTVIENTLICEAGKCSIDFQDFERKITEHNIKLFLLCNPHNPVGRVWSLAELTKIRDICRAHGTTVFSDEIHCDFVWTGHMFTSFGSIDDDAIIATAPTKTFNLAGLQVSNIIIKNHEQRNRFRRALASTGYSLLGTAAILACKAAYLKGEQWLIELKGYLEANISFAEDYLKTNLPAIKLSRPEGTYLLWLDFSSCGLSRRQLDAAITHKAKLWLNSGHLFGEAGVGFQRMNAACPRATLAEALNRLSAVFK